MVDGIAGSGKSTILRAAKTLALERGHCVFDLGEWSATHPHPPRFEEVADHDVFFTFEPTRQWMGAAIRQEFSRADASYTTLEIAQAFSLDRLIMYRRLILPALENGKCVIQDRAVSSSLVYQSIMDPSLTVKEISDLPGNKLALEHAPNLLILTHLDPEVAIARMAARDEESKGIFGQLDLLRQVQASFLSKEFRALFEPHGTNIEILDTSTDLETTLTNARNLLSPFLS